MLIDWLPWRFIIQRLARRHGFIDPLRVLSHIQRFGQPSEVTAPIELVRAGVVFHARGLMNTKAIQYNLDWVWPYWVKRQFDPNDVSFLPRAFSFTQVNLTHRNWTAIGLPECNAMPIVDPRGLLTPFFDGWSLDFWIIARDIGDLLPSRSEKADQEYLTEPDDLRVHTRTADNTHTLETQAHVQIERGRPVCRVDCAATTESGGWFVVALRPFNPEGVSRVTDIVLDPDEQVWHINKLRSVEFSRPVERHVVSSYHHGDVHLRIMERPETASARCEVGLATAAAMYKLSADEPLELSVGVDLAHDRRSAPVLPHGSAGNWSQALRNIAELRVPDPQFQFLYDAAVRSLVLLSPQDVYPGPYTYKRFWFRDAALILHAMLAVGLMRRSERVIEQFPSRQHVSGFFCSQEGEWDSNGQVLWILHHFSRLAGRKLDEDEWYTHVSRGAKWIKRKRRKTGTEAIHAGLLPAGFSAEHLGNNDYYYWDDFWGVAGLHAAAELCDDWDRADDAEQFRNEARRFMHDIERTLERSGHIRNHPGIPASPHRRMDAGAIGSIAVTYPLRLWEPRDPRVLGLIDYLMQDCLVGGAFFQDMIHSGLNAYLTLHIAQALLRAGDPRWSDLVHTVAAIASPTGQWPEAIHPRTGGGCMGDGHHLWAGAEWVMMVKNMFCRQEGDRLILGSGIPESWRTSGEIIQMGPIHTPWGPITVTIEPTKAGAEVAWEGNWHGTPPLVEIRLPGLEPRTVEDPDVNTVTVSRIRPKKKTT